MSKLVLIPGFGTNIRYSGNNTENIYRDFDGFKNLIDNKSAIIYKWNGDYNIKGLRYINPFTYYSIYREEKSLIDNEIRIEGLKDLLNKHSPETIVAHSMGSYLLYKYLEKYKLPESLKRIILIQADIDREQALNIAPDIEVINYNCNVDPALWSSLLLNKYIPAGLIGFKSEKINNKHLHAKLSLNPHTSNIKSEEKVKSLLK